MYQNFKYLTHSGVLVYILPRNDFFDNDRKAWENDYYHKKRLKPYFGTSENPLAPYYFPEASKVDIFSYANRPSFYVKLRYFLKYYFWSNNALSSVVGFFRGGDYTVLEKVELPNRSYYNDHKEQQRNLVLAHEEIVKVSGERDVLFVIIPWQEDIRQYKLRDLPDSYKQSLWYRRLKDMTATNGRKISFLDLMEYLPEDTDRLFFSCDGHWSPHGNRWAAKTIYQHIKENELFTPKEPK